MFSTLQYPPRNRPVKSTPIWRKMKCTWPETYFRQDLFPVYLFFRRQFHAIVIFRLKSISDLDSGSLPRFFLWTHIHKIKNRGVVTRLNVMWPKLRPSVDRVRVWVRGRLGVVSNSVSSGKWFLINIHAKWTLTEICWFQMIRSTRVVLNDKKMHTSLYVKWLPTIQQWQVSPFSRCQLCLFDTMKSWIAVRGIYDRPMAAKSSSNVM